MNDRESAFDALDTHPSLREAASWRLVAELARRHPEEVRIIETHPGGGQYDCLALITRNREPETLLSANRLGSIHLGAAGGLGRMTWTDYLVSADPRAFLLDVEGRIGLDAPPTVPAATPLTITWRAFAHLTSAEFLGVHGLTVRSGMDDNSAYGVGPREELFRRFPAARERSRDRHDDDPFGEPTYRFWFVIRDDEPVVAVEADTSRAWWSDGTELSLYGRYTANDRRLAATVAHVFAPALS